MRIKLHGNPFYLSIFQDWAVAFLEAPEQYHSNTFILLNFKVLLFIYLVCEEGHTYTHMYMYKSKHVAVITWRSWENVREPVLPSITLVLDHTQDARLGGKCLFPLLQPSHWFYILFSRPHLMQPTRSASNSFCSQP